MKPEQCLLDAAHSEILDEKSVTRLFFSVPEENKNEPPVLKIGMFTLTPCVPNIKVFIIPLDNYQKGADCWYVYRYSGMKRKFVDDMIDHTNEMLSRCPENERQRVLDANPHMYLTNPDKYDLD